MKRIDGRKASDHQRLKFLDSLSASWKDNMSDLMSGLEDSSLAYANMVCRLKCDRSFALGSIYVHSCLIVVNDSWIGCVQELSDTIVITGRLPPENVYQYLIQIRNCPSSSRVCIPFHLLKG